MGGQTSSPRSARREELLDRVEIPVERAAVSTGRDGDGERSSFFGFLLRPTKRQSSTQPVGLRARQAEKRRVVR
jgi:hypothetical protein